MRPADAHRKEAASMWESRQAAARRGLAALAGEQRARFERLRPRCAEYWKRLRVRNRADLLTGQWKDAFRELERRLMPLPPFDFLRDPVVDSMLNAPMIARRTLPAALDYVQRRLSLAELRRLLREDAVGAPDISLPRYGTSYPLLYKLKLLLGFEEATGRRCGQVRRIVEWGGGCGGMAKLFRRRNPGVTHIIVDAPLASCLQWLYLSSIFGTDAVAMMANAASPVVEGAINLMPLNLLEEGRLPRPDLFLSTFALNESSRAAIARVLDCGWFGAKHLLVGYTRRPNRAGAAAVEAALASSGALIHPPGPDDCAYLAYR